MAQKIQSVLIFFIVCILVYYGIVIEENKKERMKRMEERNVELKGDYNLDRKFY